MSEFGHRSTRVDNRPGADGTLPHQTYPTQQGVGEYTIPQQSNHGYDTEYVDRPANRQEKKASKWSVKRLLGGFVAGLTTVAAVGTGVVAYGLSSGGEKEAKQPPVAEAPAVPGEQAPANQEGLTPETYDFQLQNGQHYRGVATLEQAIGIPFDATAANPNAEKVLGSAVDLINLWGNYGTTNAAESNEHKSYISSDQQLVGQVGVNRDVVDPAMEQILFAEPSNGVGSTSNFIPWMEKQHRQNGSYGHETLQAHDDVLYKEGFVITSEMNVAVATNEAISATIPVAQVDNGNQNVMGKLRSQPGGYDGITSEQISYGGQLMHITLEPHKSKNGTMQWKIVALELEASNSGK